MVRSKRIVVSTGGGVLLIIFFVIVLPSIFQSTYKSNSANELVASTTEEELIPEITHISTPESLKALYMTACVASGSTWRNNLKDLINTTELNAVVIDIKDATGRVSFPNTFSKPVDGKGCVVGDMKEFIKELHTDNIYVIGRISVFQDPSYTALHPELAVKSKASGGVWKDRKGLSFIDVGAEPYWNYILEISKASYDIGFDELNYDYVRYPSDGNMDDANFTFMTASSTKAATLESFFLYLHTGVKNIRSESGEVPIMSADLFGMTTTVESDMGIGQVLERALPHFDYIAPMVYPSHYPSTWSGFANPAEYPYEVIKIAMSRGVERERNLNIKLGNYSVDADGATTTPASKLRPWLQDFDLGADYDAAKVRAQMQATYDSGLSSWMIWSAANTYTREALQAEQ